LTERKIRGGCGRRVVKLRLLAFRRKGFVEATPKLAAANKKIAAFTIVI
jgi:hypothetical protein